MPENGETRAQKRLKVSWWKLAVGLILVVTEIKNWLTPNQDFPEALKAANETQQGTIFVVSCATFLVGLAFIVAGLRVLWLNRP
jgi:hypothetical protein